jgi:hypothetical protein
MDGMENSPGKRGRHHQSALLHRWLQGDAEEVAQEEIWLRP